MSQEKQISQMLNTLLSDDLASADRQLKGIMETKLVARIRKEDAKLDEGFFDRLGAKASGFKAGIGAKAQNFGTGVKGAAKAAGQALTGQLGKAGMTLTKTQGAINKNDPEAANKQAVVQSITQSVQTDLEKLFPGDPAIQKVLAALAELQKGAAAATAPAATPKTNGPAKAKVSPAVAAPGTPSLKTATATP